MERIFLGKPLHWAIGVAVIGVLLLLGQVHAHVRWFSEFIGLLFAIALGVLGAIYLISRPGEAITREPLEEAAEEEPAAERRRREAI